ncbi:MAG TPA: hypothetical protein VM406_01740 [Noviherbaspirillum sp.]|nr:hypothetical protein [Noviherbaspirillum sp.]
MSKLKKVGLWVLGIFVGLTILGGIIGESPEAQQAATPAEYPPVAAQPVAAVADPEAERKAAKEQAHERARAISAKALEGIKLAPKWESVEARKVEADYYHVVIWYKRDPSSYGEVERDTKEVARALLREIQSAGALDEKNYFMVVAVSGRMKEKGETGRDMVRLFGETTYDISKDSLKFKPSA